MSIERHILRKRGYKSGYMVILKPSEAYSLLCISVQDYHLTVSPDCGTIRITPRRGEKFSYAEVDAIFANAASGCFTEFFASDYYLEMGY